MANKNRQHACFYLFWHLVNWKKAYTPNYLHLNINKKLNQLLKRKMLLESQLCEVYCPAVR